VLALSPDILATGPWAPGMPVWLRIRQARLMQAGETALAR
jgi:hypothetical protein